MIGYDSRILTRRPMSWLFQLSSIINYVPHFLPKDRLARQLRWNHQNRTNQWCCKVIKNTWQSLDQSAEDRTHDITERCLLIRIWITLFDQNNRPIVAVCYESIHPWDLYRLHLRTVHWIPAAQSNMLSKAWGVYQGLSCSNDAHMVYIFSWFCQ